VRSCRWSNTKPRSLFGFRSGVAKWRPRSCIIDGGRRLRRQRSAALRVHRSPDWLKWRTFGSCSANVSAAPNVAAVHLLRMTPLPNLSRRRLPAIARSVPCGCRAVLCRPPSDLTPRLGPPATVPAGSVPAVTQPVVATRPSVATPGAFTWRASFRPGRWLLGPSHVRATPPGFFYSRDSKAGRWLFLHETTWR
jgi:hypothetical protein